MVGMFHVRIDPHTACSQVDQRDLPKSLEVVNRLVHRAERDRGHLRSGFQAEALHGGVRVGALKQPEQRVTLRGDAQATRPEQRRELVCRFHVLVVPIAAVE